MIAWQSAEDFVLLFGSGLLATNRFVPTLVYLGLGVQFPGGEVEKHPSA